MYRTIKQDIKIGIQSEDEVIHHLEKIIGCPLTKTANQYDSMDFKGDKGYVELKTRLWTPYGQKVNHDTYPTTIVSQHKIIDAKKIVESGGEVYFVFRFADGLYYWCYCQNDFEIRDQYRYRDGQQHNCGKHIHIPITELLYFSGS